MFFGEDDYRRYLSLLDEFFGRYAVRIHGYCQMPNHLHLVPVPALADALSRAMGLIDQRYSPFLNFRDGLSAHRWQNRFFSCPLDATYSLRVLRYVERNPARAHLVAHPWESMTLPDVPGEVATFRLATTIGRPLGSDAFVDHLEEVSGHRLRPYPVGRPRKEGRRSGNHGNRGKRRFRKVGGR